MTGDPRVEKIRKALMTAKPHTTARAALDALQSLAAELKERETAADAAEAEATLIRDGTIFGPRGTEIDFRTPDYSVWLTVKADRDAQAEAVAAAIERAFGASAMSDVGATSDQLAKDLREDSLELLALALAHYGDADNAKLSDLIPQRVWDSLFQRDLLSVQRDITDEGVTSATSEGVELLLRSVEDLASLTASARPDVSPATEGEGQA